MNRKSLIVTAASMIAASAVLAAQTPAKSAPPQKKSEGKSVVADQAFVKEAASDGLAEVELGKLASDKATNDKVKSFGQRMVTDHGKANDELKTLASTKQMTVPTSVDPKHQATRDRLAKLSGAQFDTAYVREMVAGHKKAVAGFMRESMSGKDPEVKAWAGKTLPTLREHLMMIEGLQKEIGSARSPK